MKFWRKPKSRLTSVTLPVIGGGVSWTEKADEREVRARKERADAFAELWKIAQSAHIGIRNNFDNVDGLTNVFTQMRTLLIQQAPAMEQADVDLAEGFLRELGKFVTLLSEQPGEDANRVREEIAETLAPVFLESEMDELEAAYERVSRLNESLKQRYREVVFGERA